ncbi:hypothetical protein E0K89_005345 [Aquicoccus sp. SCR17]|nr:hypothetical protein [Carideicomes alvinocaridis]
MKDENATYQYAALVRHFDRAARRAEPQDIESYLVFFDGLDMSDAEKRAQLKTLAMIVQGFVDLAFGDHPLQQACGKTDKVVDRTTETDSNRNRSKQEQEEAHGPYRGSKRGLEAE